MMTDFNPTSPKKVGSIRVPTVSNVVVARLRPSNSPSGMLPPGTQIVITNRGDTSAVCLAAYSVPFTNPTPVTNGFAAKTEPLTTSTRTQNGNAVYVKPGCSKTITPTAAFNAFLEIYCAYGESDILIEVISSSYDWDMVEFSKDDTKASAKLGGINTDGSVTLTAAPKSAVFQKTTTGTSWVVTHTLGYQSAHFVFDDTGTDLASIASYSAEGTGGYTVTLTSTKSGYAVSFTAP